MKKSKSAGELPSDKSDIKNILPPRPESTPSVTAKTKTRARLFSHEPIPRLSLLHLPSKLTLDGTFNFFIFCLLSGAIPLLISRSEKDGHLWKYWTFLSTHTEKWWVAFLIWWVMALFTCVTFLATKLEYQKVIGSRAVFFVYIFTQLSISLGASFAVYHFQLPSIMAGGTIMQLIVHMMKVHSYWDTNRLLRKSATTATITKENSSEYTKHVTFWNYLHFLSAPTLTYETSYPMTNGIRWKILLKEIISASAALFLLMVLIVELLVEQFPKMCAQNALLMILQLTLPCMLVWCVAFYAVFHCICNFAAEITRFADREFYADWWNAQNFDEWWKRWNKPVHEWFLRHIYMQLQKKLDKNSAAVVSFMISAVLHEIVIAAAFGLVPPFLLCFMMIQLVLIFAGRKSMLSGHLGNLIMWAALFIGQPMLVLLSSPSNRNFDELFVSVNDLHFQTVEGTFSEMIRPLFGRWHNPGAPNPGCRYFASLPVPKGTRDLFQEDLAKHYRIINAARSISERYGYEEIVTPIFEHKQIFQKSLGEDSDVVRKEMYTFKDAAENELTLRPEGTAAVVRSLISNKLYTQLPKRFFYQGPMFRYESPQRGRSRQFHQIGAELYGIGHPSAELELLSMASTLLSQLGLTATLEINSIADTESRAKYRNVLQEYFRSKESSLSAESKARLQRGSVLRILDSKEEQDREVIQSAPLITEHYSSASHQRFAEVKSGLEALSIDYVHNPRLVRGLDYYSHTIFEFVSNHPLLVGQRTLLAGGRYDDLVGLMRGKGEVPAIGWAAGIERMSIVMPSTYESLRRGVAVIVVRDSEEDSFVESDPKNGPSRYAQKLLHELRKSFPTIYFSSGNTSKQLSRAIGHHLQPFAAIFVGSDELSKGKLTVKELDTSKTTEVQIDSLKSELEKLRTSAPPAQAPIPKTANREKER